MAYDAVYSREKTGGSVVVDLLFYVPSIVCKGSVLVLVLVYITLCPF